MAWIIFFSAFEKSDVIVFLVQPFGFTGPSVRIAPLGPYGVSLKVLNSAFNDTPFLYSLYVNLSQAIKVALTENAV